MAGPSISVAMCTFNGGRFLRPQLESIAAQDLPPDEMVICDDGSSDGSLDILREFAHLSSFPVRLVINRERLGSTRNFEKVISSCRSEIVVLADQDDVWYRHKLRRMREAFQRSSGIVAAFSDADLIDDDSHLAGSRRLWSSLLFSSSEQRKMVRDRALEVLVKHPVVTGAAMAFRRELFDRMAPIPSNEIHDRWMSFLLAACGRFDVIDEALMQYRRHTGQQIGPGPMNLLESVAVANRRGAQFYFAEIARFRQLSEKIKQQRTSFPYADDAIGWIANKIRHLECRAQLPRRKFARIPQILREIANRNYWLYSGGVRSLMKDLVLH
jgi:glycosyltransferase involved in cell wall biosynthesis